MKLEPENWVTELGTWNLRRGSAERENGGVGERQCGVRGAEEQEPVLRRKHCTRELEKNLGRRNKEISCL